VVLIVLIPSAALLITGASVSSVLISEALSARNFDCFLQQGVSPFTQYQSAVEQERTLSLRSLGGDRQALAGLQGSGALKISPTCTHPSTAAWTKNLTCRPHRSQ
jgi:hypothetical protein